MPSALTAVIMPMMSVPTPRWCRVKAVSGMVAPRPRPTTPMLTTRAKKSRHGMCFMIAPAGWKRSFGRLESGMGAWESKGTLPVALVFGAGRAYDDFSKGNTAKP